ncbi:MAG: ribose-phosphate pyrophosphokinase, partial [Myxococcales bacterium]|nr:ribose-phosphate pyrophosphokinase [Myxococcales bacterium]
VVVCDTIRLGEEALACSKIKVVSISALLGEAMRRINNEESVSSLFV